jgi:myosin-5
VEYTTANFIEKNKDEMPQEGIVLLLSSSRPFVSYLGSILSSTNGAGNPIIHNGKASNNYIDNSGSVGSGNTKSSLSRASVSAQFSAQLRELRERIDRTSPHYVRWKQI